MRMPRYANDDNLTVNGWQHRPHLINLESSQKLLCNFARGFFLLILSEFLGYQNAWLSSHSATFAVDKMVFSYPICFPWWFILKSENAKFFHFDITSEGKMDSCVLWQMLRLRPSMDIKGLLNSAGDAFDSRMLLVFIFAQAFAFISAHFFSRFKAKWKNEAGTTF